MINGVLMEESVPPNTVLWVALMEQGEGLLCLTLGFFITYLIDLPENVNKAVHGQ